MKQSFKPKSASADISKAPPSPDRGITSFDQLESKASIAFPPLQSLSINYNDKRPGIAPHPAIDFIFTPDCEISAAECFRSILDKDDFECLISGSEDKVDFNKKLPSQCKVSLFLDSCSKAYSQHQARIEKRGPTISQQQDLRASGLVFADDAIAAVVCAALFKKAKDVGYKFSGEARDNSSPQANALSKEELKLLNILEVGNIRTLNGNLRIRCLYSQSEYRLYFSVHCGDKASHYLSFAFGNSKS